jgi:hypothetical protein
METLRLEGDPPITKWEVFKTFIKSQIYPIGMYRINISFGITSGRGKGEVCKSTPSS